MIVEISVIIMKEPGQLVHLNLKLIWRRKIKYYAFICAKNKLNFITLIFNNKFTYIQYMKVVVFYFYYVKADIKVQVHLTEVRKRVSRSPSKMTEHVWNGHLPSCRKALLLEFNQNCPGLGLSWEVHSNFRPIPEKLPFKRIYHI